MTVVVVLEAEGGVMDFGTKREWVCNIACRCNLLAERRIVISCGNSTSRIKQLSYVLDLIERIVISSRSDLQCQWACCDSLARIPCYGVFDTGANEHVECCKLEVAAIKVAFVAGEGVVDSLFVIVPPAHIIVGHLDDGGVVREEDGPINVAAPSRNTAPRSCAR